jgi:hypothetical protein
MENQEMVSTTENVEKEVQTSESVESKTEKKTEKTFTRDELNKILATERNSLKAELKAEFEAEKTEAEKLAKMNAQEKLQHELKKEKEDKLLAQKKLNAYELKNEAQKMALNPEMGLDVGLLDLIDFNTVTAEQLNDNLGKIKSVFDEAVERRINDRLKEKSPKSVTNQPNPKDSELDKLRKHMGLN